MTHDVTLDVDKLARGEAIDRAAFLALLGDSAARQGLQQAALVSAVLVSTGGGPEVPPGMVMSVSWEELTSHAEGALLDESRRFAVELFLNQHFPEALQARIGGGETGTGTVAETTDTILQPPPTKPTARAGEEDLL